MTKSRNIEHEQARSGSRGREKLDEVRPLSKRAKKRGLDNLY